MKTPTEIIVSVCGYDETDARFIIAELAKHGYQIMQAVKWPHTIEHEPTPAERGVF